MFQNFVLFRGLTVKIKHKNLDKKTQDKLKSFQDSIRSKYNAFLSDRDNIKDQKFDQIFKKNTFPSWF